MIWEKRELAETDLGWAVLLFKRDKAAKLPLRITQFNWVFPQAKPTVSPSKGPYRKCEVQLHRHWHGIQTVEKLQPTKGVACPLHKHCATRST